MSGPDNQGSMMNALVLTNIRARDAQGASKEAGTTSSDLSTPEGAREVLNSPLWPSNELMAKAAIVEL